MQEDAFGKPIPSDDTEQASIFRTFQIAREVRNAVTRSKKQLSLDHPKEFLAHIEARLKLRHLSPEGIKTGMEKARRLVRK